MVPRRGSGQRRGTVIMIWLATAVAVAGLAAMPLALARMGTGTADAGHLDDAAIAYQPPPETDVAEPAFAGSASTAPASSTSAGTQPGATSPAATGSCPAVKIIGARGTGEAPGLGHLLTQVATRIDAAVTTPSVAVGVDYPASSDFLASAAAGTASLRRMISDAARACPQQRLVLLGYSQGAIVVGDALAATGAAGAANVAAVVLFGDPRFNSAEPYDVGSFARGTNGMYPRPTGQLSAFAGRIRDWCNGGDTVCQGAGAAGTGSHLEYGQFADAAATFVAARR